MHPLPTLGGHKYPSGPYIGLIPSFLSMVAYLCLLRDRSIERSKIQINKYIFFLSDYDFLYKIYYHYKMLLARSLAHSLTHIAALRAILTHNTLCRVATADVSVALTTHLRG